AAGASPRNAARAPSRVARRAEQEAETNSVIAPDRETIAGAGSFAGANRPRRGAIARGAGDCRV
ncbi:hypothetical protein, partial [Burkholderia pseudomallei]|uniref:hypothetical protein n=1 Tax=Burkholderia pseudomallei TaxID=28450 RepID=UPI0015C3C8D1